MRSRHITQEMVLDNPVRNSIYNLVFWNPGIHYSIIKDILNLNNGSISHHINVLEGFEYLKSEKIGIYRKFFPFDMAITDEHKTEYPSVRQGEVYVLVKEAEDYGLTVKEITTLTGRNESAIRRDIRALLRMSLIDEFPSEWDSRTLVYKSNGRDLIAELDSLEQYQNYRSQDKAVC
ncbi:MAG: hypothetical protein ACE5J7_00350 [Candidatus Aenigmatarchaeota archaeon]